MTFTAHNVELLDGSFTFPTNPPLVDSPLAAAVVRTAINLCPPRRPDGTRSTVVDLGCLEGGFTELFARNGYDALGIEARAASIANCEVVRAGTGHDHLRFAQDDARNLAAHGSFDITFCAGLLYHLDDPVAMLETIAAVTSRVLILDTHFAPATLEGSHFEPVLSDWAVNEERPGRWFHEWPKGTSPEDVAGLRWASLDNHRSFWIEPLALMQTLVDIGFDTVYEQWDHHPDITHASLNEDESRSLFVAVKSGARD